MVLFDDMLIGELVVPWRDALVVKALGLHVGYQTMRDHLKTIWKPVTSTEVVSARNGYFMVKFD